jgi:multiple sugar transport system permease protein
MIARFLRRMALLCFLFFMIGPFAVMFLTAVKSTAEVDANPLWPSHFAWDNLWQPWSEELPLFFKNSLFIAAGTTLLNLLLSLPAAYALARLPAPGKKTWRLVLIATQMFSPIVVVVSLLRLARTVHLTDSLPGLILVNTAYSLAFAIWLLTAYIAAVPDDIEEAALVDGCSRLSAFFRVLLPVALPGIVTTVVFIFIGAWNEYVIALTFLESAGKRPLTLGLSQYASAYEPQWNLLMAGALWAILPVIFLFAFIEKHLAAGLTAGAVK